MNPPKHPKGVTLIELTVVISMVLTLLSGLFVGASYYRDSASQAACIAQISQIQKGIRSYQNLESLNYGDAIIEADVIGSNKAIGAIHECPLGGNYILLNVIPNPGTPFARCETYGSSPQEHFPANTSLY
ncbi:type II secretion system protein [Rubritalea sp.]|uniref:type II secretion system protein n=1 Tax=Rubritalea sp. TaxID=2109375 RepID=UPI003EF9CDB3